MFEFFQDSMAITHYFKCLDIIEAMTATSEWLEIKNTLLPE